MCIYMCIYMDIRICKGRWRRTGYITRLCSDCSAPMRSFYDLACYIV